MARMISFTLEFTTDGKAKIQVPHDNPDQQADADEIQDLTQDLADALGKIEERHEGGHHHHHHHDHKHLTN